MQYPRGVVKGKFCSYLAC